jgi:selenocysteine lyase/cysteine desulfurase
MIPHIRENRKGSEIPCAIYYTLAVTERLGVEESGGMVRVGIAHYNTLGEVERLLAVVNDLALYHQWVT